MIFDGYALERADHLLRAEQWQRLADDPRYITAQRQQFARSAERERQIAGLLQRFAKTVPLTHEEG